MHHNPAHKHPGKVPPSYGQPDYDQPHYDQPRYEQPPYGQPVFVEQPRAGQMVTQVPWGQAATPASLQLLAQVDKIVLKRKIDCFKCYTGCETNAEYEIFDGTGLLLFGAREDSDFCSRYTFCATRAFKISVFDNTNIEVMRISRHLKACQGAWCACSKCCGHEVLIQSPIHEVAGYVHQTHGCFMPSYQILDSLDQDMLRVEGPCCIFYGWPAFCCQKQDFKVTSNTPLIPIGGMISKVWSGCIKELLCFDAKDFEINFPPGLDVKGKASMLGAAILVDFMIWYNNRNPCGCLLASLAAR